MKYNCKGCLDTGLVEDCENCKDGCDEMTGDISELYSDKACPAKPCLKCTH